MCGYNKPVQSLTAIKMSNEMSICFGTYMALSPSSSYRLLAVPPPGLPVGSAIWIRAVLTHSAWRLDTQKSKHSYLKSENNYLSRKIAVIRSRGLKASLS